MNSLRKEKQLKFSSSTFPISICFSRERDNIRTLYLLRTKSLNNYTDMVWQWMRREGEGVVRHHAEGIQTYMVTEWKTWSRKENTVVVECACLPFSRCKFPWQALKQNFNLLCVYDS